MGTSRTPADFVGKIKALPDAIEKAEVRAVAFNVKNAKHNAENEARKATGGDMKLSGAGALIRAADSRRVVGRKGAKLSVKAKIGPNKKAGEVSAVGSWPLIENDTPRHEIGPSGQKKETIFGPALTKKGRSKKLKSASGKSTARGREGRALALRTPYGLKRRVLHPGTKGKKPWATAAKKSEREALPALKRLTAEEMTKVLK